MSNEKPVLLRADEWADLLRLSSPNSARAWAKHHLPESIIRLGGLVRYRRDRVESLLEPARPPAPPALQDNRPAPPVLHGEEGAR